MKFVIILFLNLLFQLKTTLAQTDHSCKNVYK